MDVLRGFDLLGSLGAGRTTIRATSATEARVEHDGLGHDARVRAVDTAPGPARVARELAALDHSSRHDAVLYVVPHVTSSLRWTALHDRRLIVTGVDDGVVIIHTHELRAPSSTRGMSPRPRGRRPWGRFALLRAFVRTAEPRTQARLARETGMTQQAVALALTGLRPLGVGRSGDGWTAVDPAVLWDAFLDEYPGPDGVRRRWAGAAPVVEQAERALTVARATSTEALLSGDVAADEQAPFRRPSVGVVYARTELDLHARSAVADAGSETLSVVVPADPTVFASAAAWSGSAPRSTDPLLTAWEVAHGRGADRTDAVANLRSVTLAGWADR
ncbi:MAG: hypothetical protein V4737_02930 [Curtobacterium sp.]